MTREELQQEERGKALLLSSLDRDRKSFDLFVKLYQDHIFSLALRIVGDYDTAMDCTQETFVKVFRKGSNFRFQSKVSTWLYRIAVNTCKNHLSSAHSRRVRSFDQQHSEELLQGDGDTTPETIYDREETHRAIDKALDSLPEDLRIIVILKDMEGKSYDEISRITAVPSGTVKSRLSKARHILRTQLKEVL